MKRLYPYLRYLILPHYTLWKYTPTRNFIFYLLKVYFKYRFFLYPEKVKESLQKEKYAMVYALVKSLERAAKNNLISPQVWEKFVRILGNIFLSPSLEKRQKFKGIYNRLPPAFIAIAPTNACNLRCKGCYANASLSEEIKLPYELISKIIGEVRELWGAHFVVLVGGEPLFYRDNDKGVLDLAAQYNDMLFLMFTNGSLIDSKVVERMKELGNVTPAISIEGWEEETDKRRGKGIFKRIESCLDNLGKNGIPFGLSITVTKDNVAYILSDEFIDYYMKKKGALYIWLFHYMPIGRDINLEIMIKPEERVDLWRRVWELIRCEHLFIADFWNCGAATNGCISAGRDLGYIYIDYYGNILPCVFNPFYNYNIKEIFAQGKDINYALQSPFLESIRKWQNDYKKEDGNFLVPCPIRDHFMVNQNLIKNTGAKTTDKGAEKLISDTNCQASMIEFDEGIESLTDSIWKKDYNA